MASGGSVARGADDGNFDEVLDRNPVVNESSRRQTTVVKPSLDETAIMARPTHETNR